MKKRAQEYTEAHGVDIDTARAMILTGKPVRNRSSIKKAEDAVKKRKGREAKAGALDAKEPLAKKRKEKGKAYEAVPPAPKSKSKAVEGQG